MATAVDRARNAVCHQSCINALLLSTMVSAAGTVLAESLLSLSVMFDVPLPLSSLTPQVYCCINIFSLLCCCLLLWFLLLAMSFPEALLLCFAAALLFDCLVMPLLEITFTWHYVVWHCPFLTA